MPDTKQVIVMRTDLNMRKGKMIAQGSHASLSFLTRKLVLAQMGGMDEDDRLTYTVSSYAPISHAEEAWLNSSFTKICVRVESEEELLAIHQAALDAGLVSHLITDLGLTEFAGVPTKTCCAIGPDFNEKIDPITKDLKLL